MGDWPVGVLILVVILVLGALIAGLIVSVQRWRRWVRRREEQDRQSYRSQLLSSLEALDLAMTNLNIAMRRGNECLARERVHRLEQAIGATKRSGDDELHRLVNVMAERCDALVAAGQDGLEEEDFEQLARQLGEVQREIYRRMEALLAQVCA
jgi:replicative DNA helicase